MNAKSTWWLAALLSGVLYGLAFPPFKFSFLAWFALVPALWALATSPCRPRSALWFGWASGFVAHLFIFFWIWKTFAAAGVGSVVALFCWLALAAVVGLYQGVFFVGVNAAGWRWWTPVVAPVLWISLEWVRTHALTGFPWALFAHTQAYQTNLIQFAFYTGALGVSALLVLINVLVARVFVARTRWAVAGLSAALIFVWGMIQYGQLIQTQYDSSLSPRSIRVAILQGNIDQYRKWDDRYEADIRDTYERLALEAANAKVDLIVWPESSVPGWYPNQPQYEMWVSSLVARTGTPHIIGAVTRRGDRDLNAAFLVDAKGRLVAAYAKQHLVPFGEYIPFGGFLSRWIPYLGQLGTFDAGPSPVVFQTEAVTVAPNICYEAIFPALVKRTVRPNVDAIVNITNDGWFLDTGAPEQHYVANIFRAIENRLPVIRSANTGISAVIDSCGREVVRSPLLTRGVYVAAVRLE